MIASSYRRMMVMHGLGAGPHYLQPNSLLHDPGILPRLKSQSSSKEYGVIIS
jgi:hypothetical protein